MDGVLDVEDDACTLGAAPKYQATSREVSRNPFLGAVPSVVAVPRGAGVDGHDEQRMRTWILLNKTSCRRCALSEGRVRVVLHVLSPENLLAECQDDCRPSPNLKRHLRPCLRTFATHLLGVQHTSFRGYRRRGMQRSTRISQGEIPPEPPSALKSFVEMLLMEGSCLPGGC